MKRNLAPPGPTSADWKAAWREEGTRISGLHAFFAAYVEKEISIHRCRQAGPRMAYDLWLRKRPIPEQRGSNWEKLSSLHKIVTGSLTHLGKLFSFYNYGFILYCLRKLLFSSEMCGFLSNMGVETQLGYRVLGALVDHVGRRSLESRGQSTPVNLVSSWGLKGQVFKVSNSVMCGESYFSQ